MSQRKDWGLWPYIQMEITLCFASVTTANSLVKQQPYGCQLYIHEPSWPNKLPSTDILFEFGSTWNFVDLHVPLV